MQIYNYQIAYGNGFRSINACDFAVKPEDGRNVNGFSGFVNFQQEGQAEEYSIYLNPGFTPLKVSLSTCYNISLSFILLHV